MQKFEILCQIVIKTLIILQVVGIEPTFLILETNALPIELYLHCRWEESNPPSLDFQSNTLPLSYISLNAFYGNRTRVFALKGQCPNQLDEKCGMLLTGIEPITSHSQYDVLTN